MSETKGYCDDHVYMPDKLLNSGDFVHVLYRENQCPYCQLAATKAELEEAKAERTPYDKALLEMGQEIDRLEADNAALRERLKEVLHDQSN